MMVAWRTGKIEKVSGATAGLRGDASNYGHGPQINHFGGGGDINFVNGNAYQFKQYIREDLQADPIKAFLNTLDFPEMDTRAHDITSPFSGTCDWIYYKRDYRVWRRMEGHQLFWVQGVAGSGKSTLLKQIHADQLFLAERAPVPQIVLSFFFNEAGFELQKSKLGLFRTMLYQLVSKMPDLKATFLQELRVIALERNSAGNRNSYHDEFHDTKEESTKTQVQNVPKGQTDNTTRAETNWHVNQLELFFHAFLQKASETHHVSIFVDAMDECPKEDASSLAILFRSLIRETSADNGVRICLSSRHPPAVEFDLKKYHVITEEENLDGIAAYTRTKVQEAAFYAQDPEIVNLIAKKSSGMFVWAQMVTDRILVPELIDTSQDFIHAMIEKYSESSLPIPELSLSASTLKLYSLYEECLKPMKDIPMSLRLMEWIALSEAPLTLKELNWALAMHPRESKTMKGLSGLSTSHTFSDKPWNKLNSITRGLVVCNGDRLEFCHHSVKEFFLHKGLMLLRRLCGINTRDAKAAIGEAHKDITSACLKYLDLLESEVSSHPELFGPWKDRDVKDFEREFPFARYSSVYWTIHSTHSELHGIDQSYLKSSFGRAPQRLVPWLECVYMFLKKDFHSVGEMLSVPDPFQIDRREDEFPRGKTNLFHVAARMGLLSLFEPLFDESVQNASKKSPDVGLDFNSEDDYGYTVLHLAAAGGHKLMVRKIIDDKRFTHKPLELRNTMGKWYKILGSPVMKSPLIIALYAGHGDVVRILLNDGRFDPTKMGLSYSFAFSALFSGAHAVNNIARFGVNLAIPLRIGQGFIKGVTRSPVPSRDPNQGAGTQDNEPLPEEMFLLDSDIPIGNALHLTAIRGDLEMVKILVTSNGHHKLDINATNPFNLTALALAALENHRLIVKYLLDNNAKAFVNAHYTNTPLFRALDKKHDGGEAVLEALLKKGMESKEMPPTFRALHLTAAVLLREDDIARSCVKTNPDLLTVYGESLRGKLWPRDWDNCKTLLHNYIDGFAREFTKVKTEQAFETLKETTNGALSLIKSQKWFKKK